MQLTPNEMREALGAGAILGAQGDATFAAVRSDSRKVAPGDLFVCIRGERFDGHDFAADVVRQGARVLIAERDPFNGECPSADVTIMVVDDSVKALGRLANLHRMRSKARVVGVTGTAGKTTVKELLAQVLGVRGDTARNPLNLNNQIGLPLSMLEATGNESFWVMEAGISQPQDMDELGAVLRPDIGLVLNVGQGHVAGLGDRGVAYYKSRLLAHLAEGGTGLVCADYDDLVREARSVCRRLQFFSASGRGVGYRAAYDGPVADAAGSDGGVRGRYRVWLDGSVHEVVAPFRGAFGAENVAAVAAAAHLCGLSGEEIAAGLAEAVLPRQRFACATVGGFVCIDDTYNANPLSSARMVEAVTEMAAGGPLVFVLGEMLELGEEAADAHERLGRQLATTGARAVFWKGGNAEAVAMGLRLGGYGGLFCAVDDTASFVDRFASLGLASAHVLFKGSRGNRLEVLRAAFGDAFATAEVHDAL
ncbi:MAG TPA: UDP-N-acetylmuramoylalanyl-D-glutamyl-2, 6-diaminopimelate--D-alanyl-D-alanine ligase [Desulfovibrio sp.]|uniref:UDP-N-acetylmuramoyl-tripeptide--D-alanyl-D- alanine ligase n=1 Tax=Nitratidesulfovibrio vulgaris TaxID=881 RepID=UPI000E808E8C|nr:UDP-N-acetylmuramoyl-tripeptide--D-alanyl-D-alanine ligase [Nitratidesulfovibrio vulgaris]WCB45995.1 UDP-N-acetylmuramoyl-tripeptide--D-alanyl-D-alanine ligase [Nitratidesulfovibrio vulgaris]HBW15954.1 UDP-N-acetylmuramoylalanyl-D-glutamyl-2, 6-diaminopimelate--D-alanyl-D-alanine ligase [Desulfovibrio sp.]